MRRRRKEKGEFRAELRKNKGMEEGNQKEEQEMKKGRRWVGGIGTEKIGE
jgi:hypothetical protein